MAANAYKMISIPEAQDLVLDQTPVLPSESVSLIQALGHTLAQPVIARDSLPPFPASIKDGYAVVSSDGAGDFPVVGESRAGSMDALDMGPGRVVYITTGAPVPPGADAVVQVEDTEMIPEVLGGVKHVRILKGAAMSGQDIRPVGSDIMAGASVLDAGQVVGVAEVGILATVGCSMVQVYSKPTVAVLSTGDEVVEPSTEHLGPGQIRDANRSMLLAAAAKSGARVIDLGIARDTEGHLQGCLSKAISLGVDVLVTSGGVSMGDRDLIKPLLEKNGTVHFGRVKMKPGKPLTFATLDVKGKNGGGDHRMLVFGLPGNPVSSFACFHLVTLPALRKMMGWGEPRLRRLHARITQDIRMDPERPEYHRATLQWSRRPSNVVQGDVGDEVFGWWAVSTGNQISSRLLSARSANAFVEVPAACGVLKAGSLVSALVIDDLQIMPVPEEVPMTQGF